MPGVILLLGVAGCAPELSVGAPCVLASDCAPPLDCLLDRCRTACVNDRDCAFGLRCVLDGGGLGGCTVPDEETCTMGACTAPLECVGGECRSSCANDDDCAESSWCAAGTCASRPATVQRCDDDADCPSGFRCGASVGIGMCFEVCTSHDDCPPGAGCLDNATFVGNMPFLACPTPCRPGTNEGCPADAACSSGYAESVLPGAPASLTFCRAVGTRVAGCACSGGNYGMECQSGMTCDRNGAPGSSCAVICEIGDDCADGSPCGPYKGMLTRDGVTYGVCAVPPTRPAVGCD